MYLLSYNVNIIYWYQLIVVVTGPFPSNLICQLLKLGLPHWISMDFFIFGTRRGCIQYDGPKVMSYVPMNYQIIPEIIQNFNLIDEFTYLFQLCLGHCMIT